MSSYRLASVLVVGLLQACFAAEVVDHKVLAAAHKTYFAKQMINLATRGYKPAETTVPSPLPVNGTYSPTGFLSLSYSFDQDCNNAIIDYGYPVDMCIVDIGYAIKFQLTQDSCIGGIVEYYRDEYCTIKAGTSDLDDFNNVCSVAEYSLLGDSETSYTKLQCTTNSVPTVAVDSGIMEYFSNNTDCDTAQEYAYVAYATNQCITIDNTTFTVSCDGNAMMWNVAIDDTPDCQGTLYPFTWPETCQSEEPSDDFYYDDADVYNPPFINPPPSVSTTPFPTSGQMSNNDSTLSFCQLANTPSAEPSAEPTAMPTTPTAVPSVAPTRMPSSMAPSAKPSTAYPTSAAITTVSFKAAQVVSGISIDTYNTNPTLYGNTLKETIAASMVGVTPDNIKNLVATASAASSIQQMTLGVATSVASLLQVKASTVRKSLRTVMSTSAISVTYTVEVATQLTVEDLESQLTASVETGVFTAMLQSNAAANGATGLETASSDSVEVTADSSDGGNNGLSDGAIAGIVIGCVAGVVLIAGVIYYFTTKKNSLLNVPNVEL